MEQEGTGQEEHQCILFTFRPQQVSYFLLSCLPEVVGGNLRDCEPNTLSSLKLCAQVTVSQQQILATFYPPTPQASKNATTDFTEYFSIPRLPP